MSQAGEGRKQSLRVPHGLEADVAYSCNWKTVVKVPCASRVDFLHPFAVGMSVLGTLWIQLCPLPSKSCAGQQRNVLGFFP